MSQPPVRINILQGLRAYAALPVVIFHTGFTLPGVNKFGVFGVHMFFLLSGYIMAHICATDRHAFVRRRLIRIIPSYWALTLLLFFVAARFPHLLNATRAVPSELIKSLLFIPFQKSNGLFQPILFIGWTINYEMYFYMLLGLAILIAPRRPLLVASIFILGIAGVGSFFTSVSAVATFYSNPVILEFVFGLLSYTCVAAFPESARSQGKYLWIGIVASSLILLPVIESFNLFPSLPLVVRYGPLSFLLISCSCLLAIGGNDLRVGLLILIGDASYTLYLVHAYFEMVLDRIVAQHLPWLHITTAFGCLFAVTLSVIASIYLFLYVEKPMLRYLNKKLCGRARDLRPSRVTAPQVAPQSVATQTATAPPALAGIQNLT